MSENAQEKVNNSFDEILGEDVVNKLIENMGVELNSKQIKELEKEAQGSTDFMKAIEKIDIPSENYVIFTDGDEQLLYENGEFYVISTKDTPLRRKKKTKKEAKEMYLNYFINYQLNGLLGESKNKQEKATPKKTKATKQIQNKDINVNKDEIAQKDKAVNIQKSVDKEIER